MGRGRGVRAWKGAGACECGGIWHAKKDNVIGVGGTLKMVRYAKDDR